MFFRSSSEERGPEGAHRRHRGGAPRRVDQHQPPGVPGERRPVCRVVRCTRRRRPSQMWLHAARCAGARTTPTRRGPDAHAPFSTSDDTTPSGRTRGCATPLDCAMTESSSSGLRSTSERARARRPHAARPDAHAPFSASDDTTPLAEQEVAQHKILGVVPVDVGHQSN